MKGDDEVASVKEEKEESFVDPPKADAIKDRLKPGGPIETSIAAAGKEAEGLLKAVNEWSNTSKGIAELSKKVAESASKDNKELQSVHIKVEKAAESGIEGLLAEDKGPPEQEDPGNETKKADASNASFLETGALPQNTSRAKDASIRHVIVNPSRQIARKQDASVQRTASTPAHHAAVKQASLVQPSIEKAGEGGAQPDQGGVKVKALMSSLHSNYATLQNLLLSAVSTAAEAKETAKIWASEPTQAFERSSQKAKEVAEGVAQELKTDHATVEHEVTDSISRLLSGNGNTTK